MVRAESSCDAMQPTVAEMTGAQVNGGCLPQRRLKDKRECKCQAHELSWAENHSSASLRPNLVGSNRKTSALIVFILNRKIQFALATFACLALRFVTPSIHVILITPAYSWAGRLSCQGREGNKRTGRGGRRGEEDFAALAEAVREKLKARGRRHGG